MASALTSNPFHLPAATNTTIRRGHRNCTRPARLPKPFVCAKKKDGEKLVAKPKGFSFDLNGDVAKSLATGVVGSSTSRSLFFPNRRRKDPDTVFVAGATGQAGVRIAQTLLREGFSVRAGVPELAFAQELARLATKYKVISPKEAKRLNAVESAFDNREAIAKAIGNAGKLIVTIGPSENGPSTGVTTADALEVVKAAELAGVGHVAIVYDASRSGFSGTSTYNILDGITLFFKNLFSPSQSLPLTEFLSKVVETGVSYTLIKATLTDDIYAGESTGGIVLYKEGTAPLEVDDYKVSKSKIASLVAGVFANTSVTENKVVEVYGSPSAATSKSTDELFSAIPVDGRRNAYKEALAKARAEEESLRASEEAREAPKVTKEPQEKVKVLSKVRVQAKRRVAAEETSEDADSAGAPLGGLFSKVKDIGSEFSWSKLSSQMEKLADNELKVQIATVGGQAKARTLTPRKAGIKKAAPPKPKERLRPETKPQTRKMFGNLFKQETIYMDD